MLTIKSDIPISFLDTLVTFFKTGTTKGTAHHLKITQPTVSRRLKALNELLPAPILIKNGRKLILTDYARSLIEGIDHPLLKIKETLNNVGQGIQDSNKASLKIAARSEIINRYFLNTEFSGKIEFIPSSSEAIHGMISRYQVDLAVIHNLKIKGDYLSRKLFSSKPQLVIPKTWAPVHLTLKQWKKICGQYPLALYKGDNTYLKKFLKIDTAIQRPKINLVAASWDFIEARCAKGKSWAILPSEYVSAQKNYWVIDLPSEFGEMNFYLVYKSELKKQAWFNLLITSILSAEHKERADSHR